MLMRFDPFRDLDRVTDQLARQTRQTPSVLAMDAVRDENEVVIYIDVPGVAVDDIDVSVDALDLDQLTATTGNGVLTISVPVAERSKPRRIDVSANDSNDSDEAIETTSTDTTSDD